jgi:hypothetical protein
VKQRDYAAIEEGRTRLLARLTAELKHADDDASAEQFIEAERIVDQYLDAVRDGSASLPDSQELAFACLLMLVVTQTIKQSDLVTLARLNAPRVGVELYSISGEISDMKARAIERLEMWASPDAGDGDVPF